MKSKKTISSSKLAKSIMKIKSFLFNEMRIYLIEKELHTEHKKRSCCSIVRQLLFLCIKWRCCEAIKVSLHTFIYRRFLRRFTHFLFVLMYAILYPLPPSIPSTGRRCMSYGEYVSIIPDLRRGRGSLPLSLRLEHIK